MVKEISFAHKTKKSIRVTRENFTYLDFITSRNITILKTAKVRKKNAISEGNRAVFCITETFAA